MPVAPDLSCSHPRNGQPPAMSTARANHLKTVCMPLLNELIIKSDGWFGGKEIYAQFKNSLIDARSKLDNCQYDQALDLVDDIWHEVYLFESAHQSTSTRKRNLTEDDNVKKFKDTILVMESRFCQDIQTCCLQSRRFSPVLVCDSCEVAVPGGGVYHETKVPTTSNQWNICHNCFVAGRKSIALSANRTDPSFTNDGRRRRITKASLHKVTNHEVDMEPRVTCSHCKSMYHAICENFHRNLTATFLCRFCRSGLSAEGPTVSTQDASSKEFVAQDLIETELSQYMEQAVNNFIPNYAEKVTIRVVFSSPNKHTLGESLKARMTLLNLPTEFSYVEKSILCFQMNNKERNGEAVAGRSFMFFGMYIQEYGEDCPDPNKNCLYISTIDSVRLFSPTKWRRQIYYYILLTYLRYNQLRGFKKVFLWSCPPRPGDEYMFFRRPRTQKDLTKTYLSHWYQKMIQLGIRVGIFLKFEFLSDYIETTTTLADFFKKFPMFAEDRWPDALEGIVKSFRASNVTSSPSKPKKKKSNSPQIDESLDLLKHIKAAFKKEKEFFMVMTLQENVEDPSAAAIKMDPDFILRSNLMHRNNFVNFFQSRLLEFRDERKAVFSSSEFVNEKCVESIDSICSFCGTRNQPNGSTIFCRICRMDVCSAVTCLTSHNCPDRGVMKVIASSSQTGARCCERLQLREESVVEEIMMVDVPVPLISESPTNLNEDISKRVDAYSTSMDRVEYSICTSRLSKTGYEAPFTSPVAFNRNGYKTAFMNDIPRNSGAAWKGGSLKVDIRYARFPEEDPSLVHQIGEVGVGSSGVMKSSPRRAVEASVPSCKVM